MTEDPRDLLAKRIFSRESEHASALKFLGAIMDYHLDRHEPVPWQEYSGLGGYIGAHAQAMLVDDDFSDEEREA